MRLGVKGFVAALAIALLFIVCFLSLSIRQRLVTTEEKLVSLEPQLSAASQELSQIHQWTDLQTNKDQALPNGAEANGQLRLDGSVLVNQHGATFQIKGFSSHGLMWYPQYVNYPAMETIRDYGANAFRLAVYTEASLGYLEEAKLVRRFLYASIENVLAADLYAIVDWHILEDGNPLKHEEEALAFFDQVAGRYPNHPGILYEICNEPNGETDWADIKAYAEKVIPVIRAHSPSALILVGTPNYSTDLRGPVEDPLEFKGILYSYHQYLDENSPSSEFNLTLAQEEDLPIFVSEWGISNEAKDLDMALEKARDFLILLDEHQISWINWSLANKAEPSSAILPAVNDLHGWEFAELSPSGQLVYQALRQELLKP